MMYLWTLLKESEYDQEKPQSKTADQPMDEEETQHRQPYKSKNTIRVKQRALSLSFLQD